MKCSICNKRKAKIYHGGKHICQDPDCVKKAWDSYRPSNTPLCCRGGK